MSDPAPISAKSDGFVPGDATKSVGEIARLGRTSTIPLALMSQIAESKVTSTMAQIISQ